MAALCSSILGMIANCGFRSSSGRVLLLPAKQAEFAVEVRKSVKSRRRENMSKKVSRRSPFQSGSQVEDLGLKSKVGCAGLGSLGNKLSRHPGLSAIHL